jgi:Mrp family chromosome partitioning ATPase/capsular polysaccharide biosynthesis protein
MEHEGKQVGLLSATRAPRDEHFPCLVETSAEQLCARRSRPPASHSNGPRAARRADDGNWGAAPMMPRPIADSGSREDILSFRDYLSVVERRKWLILLSCVLLSGGAALVSSRQEHLFAATAEVVTVRHDFAAGVAGAPVNTRGESSERVVQAEAAIATLPAVAERVLEAANVRKRTPLEFLEQATVTPRPNADILKFQVTDSDADVAVRLATEHARQFTTYRRELETSALKRARERLTQQIGDVKADGGRGSDEYAELISKKSQLLTIEALEAAKGFVVRPAEEAVQTQPKLLRNVIFGLGLGLVAGVLLAFFREALDTRARSADEVAERLNLPLLARLPAPNRRLRRESRLPMLSNPNGVHAEGFRVLRMNLDFAILKAGAQTVMVTSPLQREQKSTTVANLGLAFARAGRQVVLVEADFRCPMLDTLFGLDGRPGLTDVAVGRVELRDALGAVAIPGLTRPDPSPVSQPGSSGNGNIDAASRGRLFVLPSGPTPADAAEFVARSAVTDMLGELRLSADLVLVDAPPVLDGSSAIALSVHVDALVVVIGVEDVRAELLAETRRLLDTSPGTKLGIIVTGGEGGLGGINTGLYGAARAKRLIANQR